jgi:MHS family shikimate/dehydroshikimate transporter-like MFS transporter
MFDAKVRYSGVSMGYQLAGIIGGGFAPMISSYLLGMSGGASWPLSLLLIALAAITLASIAFTKESSKRDL